MFLRYDSSHVQYVEAEIDEAFGKQDVARVFVRRGQLTESAVERGETEMFIVETTGTSNQNAEFGGILRDISQRGSLTEFIVESFERYARDALPTPSADRYENADDSTIISDAIGDVSQLSVGTVNTVRSPMTMVFSHTSQAKKIREVETSAGGEVKYRSDKSVDYVASLGADKTGTTISPSNQNLAGDFNAERKGGDEDVTHLRLVGAGEARHQQTVNFVPQDDPVDYENDPDFDNVNRYSASHWSSGDRKEWEVRANKDLTDIDSLERLGETIVNDVQESHIEAEADIEGVEVNLGDEFTVVYPEEDIDQSARVVALTTAIDAEGFTYKATLSSRQQSLEDPEDEQYKDTDRYNLAFEGSPVTMTTSGGRQPVNSTTNYQFSFYYPAEVKFEHRVQLFVKGLEYRAYSQGAASGESHTHLYNKNNELEHSHSYNTNNELEHGHTYNTNNELEHGHTYNTNNELEHGHSYNTNNELEHGHVVNSTQVTADEDTDTDGGATIVESSEDSINHFTSFYTLDEHSHPIGGKTVDSTTAETSLDVQETTDTELNTQQTTDTALDAQKTTDAELGVQQTTNAKLKTLKTTEAEADHTHDPQPGIITQFPDHPDANANDKIFPENCDVLVNGNSQNVSLGSGGQEFDGQVDLSGDLIPGQVNTVEITSDTLGHIQAHLDIDVYRQILGRG